MELSVIKNIGKEIRAVKEVRNRKRADRGRRRRRQRTRSVRKIMDRSRKRDGGTRGARDKFKHEATENAVFGFHVTVLVMTESRTRLNIDIKTVQEVA